MVKQDVLLDLLPEGGWIDLHKPRLTPLKNEELTLYQRFLLFLQGIREISAGRLASPLPY
jgi:hypothetical protein